MIYETNKCTEYAIKDENGNPLTSKTTIANVKTLIESGAVSNAKPIYCHPIEIFKANTCILTCLIFNNSSEKIDTWDKLKLVIKSFGGNTYNRLLVTGGYKKNTDIVIASEIVHYVSSDKYFLSGVTISGTIETGYTYELTNVEFTSVVDDVNRIN